MLGFADLFCVDAPLHCSAPVSSVSFDKVSDVLISPEDAMSLWAPEFDSEEVCFLEDLNVDDFLCDDLDLESHLDLDLAHAVLDVRAHSSLDIKNAFDSLVDTLNIRAEHSANQAESDLFFDPGPRVEVPTVEVKKVISKGLRALTRAEKVERKLFFKKVACFVEIFHNSIPAKHIRQFWHGQVPVEKFLRRNSCYIRARKTGEYELTLAGKRKFNIASLS